jgi:hypothetical protein
MASSGLRWYGVGGCWETPETAKTDEEVNQERASQGEGIAHIGTRTWRGWTRRERRVLRCVVADQGLSDDNVVEYVVACGGWAGPAPKSGPDA